MKRRMTKVTAMVAVLLLGLLAAPAAAQENGTIQVEDIVVDGFTALQCSEGVALANEELNPAVFEVEFADFFNEDLDVIEGDEQALVDATVAFLDGQGQTLADVCSIYVAEVEGVIITPDPDPEPADDPDPTPADDPEPPVRPELPEQADAVAAEVLGVTLQRTGIDALLMAVIGAGLLGLGVLAVRRTREDDTPA